MMPLYLDSDKKPRSRDARRKYSISSRDPLAIRRKRKNSLVDPLARPSAILAGTDKTERRS